MARRTADSIEESLSVKEPKAKRKMNPNSLRNLVAPWPKGFAPNPAGKGGKDIAREVARAVFEGNREEIYARMTAALFGGNAYAFQVLADRGYGKLKETKEVHVFEGVEDADLDQRISSLLRDLGLGEQADEAARIGIAAAGEAAPKTR